MKFAAMYRAPDATGCAEPEIGGRACCAVIRRTLARHVPAFPAFLDFTDGFGFVLVGQNANRWAIPERHNRVRFCRLRSA